MRRAILIGLAFAMVGCAVVGGRVSPTCRPTGWVDRVEGRWVVIEPDGDAEETLVLPVSCFSEPLHGGLRIVAGRIDRAETEALRRRIAKIAARLPAVRDSE